MGSSEMTNEFRKNLVAILEDRFDFYNKANKNKFDLFRARTIECYINAKKQCVDHYGKEMGNLFVKGHFMDDDKFEEQHKKIFAASVKIFHSLKGEGGDTSTLNQFRNQAYGKLNWSYKRFGKINVANREKSENITEDYFMPKIANAKELYSCKMEGHCSGKMYMEDNILLEAHNLSGTIVLSQFNEFKKRYPKKFDLYQKRLILELELLYKKCVEHNNAIRKEHFATIDNANRIAVVDALNYYKQQAEIFEKTQKSSIILPDDAQKKHEELKCKALLQFMSEAVKDSASFSTNYKTLEEKIDEAYEAFKKIMNKDKSTGCTIS